MMKKMHSDHNGRLRPDTVAPRPTRGSHDQLLYPCRLAGDCFRRQRPCCHPVRRMRRRSTARGACSSSPRAEPARPVVPLRPDDSRQLGPRIWAARRSVFPERVSPNGHVECERLGRRPKRCRSWTAVRRAAAAERGAARVRREAAQASGRDSGLMSRAAEHRDPCSPEVARAGVTARRTSASVRPNRNAVRRRRRSHFAHASYSFCCCRRAPAVHGRDVVRAVRVGVGACAAAGGGKEEGRAESAGTQRRAEATDRAHALHGGGGRCRGHSGHSGRARVGRFGGGFRPPSPTTAGPWLAISGGGLTAPTAPVCSPAGPSRAPGPNSRS